ncbi:Hypothetical predicted protein [Cloeon dipterum]|uniref:CRAL-TRIO domain-containing protein n=1 Tax=Cloeon dipterum TaxID=197152 RepID=A0A8S1CYZ1_9INSE|nr:Hypothetical predicted protein [Cloeon dipterum]
MEDNVGDLKIRPLSTELLEHAKKKLNEDPKRRADDVKAIREWLKKQKHIIGEPSDQMIVNFLRGCKFSLERTKEKLDMHFTMKTLVPELFKNRDVASNPHLREALDLGFFFPLGLDNEGRKVFMFLGGKDDPDKKMALDIFKVNYMMMDYFLLNDDVGVVKGAVFVSDMSNFKMGHMTQAMPSLMKKVAVCSEEGYPFRPQAMHVIKMPSFMETMFKLYQSFTKEKLNRRTFVHGKDYNTLFEKVPRKIVPQDFHGEGPHSEELAKKFAAEVLAFNDFFVADEKNGVDEKKRVGKSKTKEDLFGMEGSFRQLTLD